LSIAQNLGSASAAGAALVRPAAAIAPKPPDSATAFNSPPRPVDFSADVAASERR